MRRFLLFAVLFSLALGSAAVSADKVLPAPSEKEKCAVCGMFVSKYPAWACRILFRDGSTAWFDGPKDLFTYYLDIKKYAPSRTRTDVKFLLVKDYYSTAFIDAEKAFYVVGSDVTGPMGSELIPFAKAADAKAFMKEHKGQKVLRAREVNPDALKALR